EPVASRAEVKLRASKLIVAGFRIGLRRDARREREFTPLIDHRSIGTCEGVNVDVSPSACSSIEDDELRGFAHERRNIFADYDHRFGIDSRGELDLLPGDDEVHAGFPGQMASSDFEREVGM